MRKISLLTLISAMGISSLVYAGNFYTDIRYANTGHIPEYQIEHAKEDFIFDEGYTDYKNLEDRREKRERIKNFYNFFAVNFGLSIPNWNKLSDIEKISELLNFLNNMSEINIEKLNNLKFLTDNNAADFYIEKYQDEFFEKVAGLEEKTEELFIEDHGKKIPLTRTTYTGSDGKKYTKDVYHYNAGPIVELKENNQPLYDYNKIEKIEGSYIIYSSKFSTDGTGEKRSVLVGNSLPKGYIVAKDRSEHLSDDEKGKLIVIPEDESLLPEGVKIIDDGRGGKIVKAPESAYKANGNLALKPDKTLQRTVEVQLPRRVIEGTEFSEQISIMERATQEGNMNSYGRDRWISDANDLYYSYSTIDANGKKSNWQTEGGKVTDLQSETFDPSLNFIDENGELIPAKDYAEKVSAEKKKRNKNSYGE